MNPAGSQDKRQVEADIHFSTSEELTRLSADIAGHSRRHLEIVSRVLNPLLYETPDFLTAIKNLVLKQRGKVRFLVLEPDSLISRGDSRLLELAIRLSSYMEIRKPGELHQEFAEAMLVADRAGFIHRRHCNRYEGIANHHSPRQAKTLAESFETLWQHAEPIPHFRRLML